MKGFVLCGGASKRMGTDKAFVPFQGVPLAKHMIGVLKQGGCEEVYLVGRNNSLLRLHPKVLFDSEMSVHPLSGIATAMSFVESELLFIAPCDAPGLLNEDVRTLLSQEHPCLGSFAGRPHPLIGVFASAWKDHTLQLVKTGAPATRLASHMMEIPFPDRKGLNVNYPEDLYELSPHDTPWLEDKT